MSASAPPSSWHPLTISSSTTKSNVPPLLVSASFTSNSYTINLTDLTHVWSEALDRRAILRRSLAEDTSIDPSEDAEQFKVFLDKIKLALEGGKDTSLALSSSSCSNDDTGKKNESNTSASPDNAASNLELRITAVLPKPLPPFEWPIHLALQGQEILTSQLTMPLIRSQNSRLRELDSLVELLREKDHVIQKLVDKLEATGAELGHVFPGAAGKGGRTVPRKVAEERVKGLAAFDRVVWSKEMRERAKKEDEAPIEGDEDVKGVLEGVFSSEGGTRFGTAAPEVPRGWEEWWAQLVNAPLEMDGSGSISSTKDGAKDTASAKARPPAAALKQEPTEKEDDDDFQVQATPPKRDQPSPSPSPPRLGKNTTPAKHARESNAIVDDSTEDEDDLAAAPSQRSQVPDSLPSSNPPKQQPKKLGTIGGVPKKTAPVTKTKAKSVDPESEPESAPAQVTRSKIDVEDEDDTATEDDEAASPQKMTPSRKKAKTPPPPPAAAKPKKGSLGKIGGKRKEVTPPTAAAAEEEVSLPERTTPKKKLGHIGRTHSPAATEKKKEGEGEVGGTKDGRGRADERKEEPEVRETSTERADRKRAELKRELEEKAKAPAKKKRKF